MNRLIGNPMRKSEWETGGLPYHVVDAIDEWAEDNVFAAIDECFDDLSAWVEVIDGRLVVKVVGPERPLYSTEPGKPESFKKTFCLLDILTTAASELADDIQGRPLLLAAADAIYAAIGSRPQVGQSPDTQP